ncbi:MAG TPA: energy transducer TonB [Candidatus Angelobacter sp.]
MTQRSLFLELMLFLFVALASAQEKPSGSTIPLKPWILHAKLTHEVLPEYPASARANHIEGDVYVNVLVDENGKIKNLLSKSLPSLKAQTRFSRFQRSNLMRAVAASKWVLSRRPRHGRQPLPLPNYLKCRPASRKTT